MEGGREGRGREGGRKKHVLMENVYIPSKSLT